MDPSSYIAPISKTRWSLPLKFSASLSSLSKGCRSTNMWCTFLSWIDMLDDWTTQVGLLRRNLAGITMCLLFLFPWLDFIDHFQIFPPYLGPRWMVTQEWRYDSFVCCTKASRWLKGDYTWLVGWVRIFFSKCAKWSRMVTFRIPSTVQLSKG